MAFRAEASEYFLELVRCGIKEMRPSEKPENVSWQEVYALAKRHGFCALTYSAVKHMEESLPDQLSNTWKDQHAKLIIKHINQDHELSRLSSLFEIEEIPYLPMKGKAISAFYPRPELREMTDIDILIPVDSMKKADALMSAEGYCASDDVCHHVEYTKPPYLVVELHTQMVTKANAMYSYYKEPWKRARREGQSFRHYFSDEDCLIFLIAHAAKHYYFNATGIKPVVDFYMITSRLKDTLDVAYMRQELGRLHLTEFAETFREVAYSWFSDKQEKLSKKAQEMAEYLLHCAPYRDKALVIRNMVANGKSERAARFSYAISGIFPNDEKIRLLYPAIKKAPILLPFCWIARWFHILIKTPGSISARFNADKKR